MQNSSPRNGPPPGHGQTDARGSRKQTWLIWVVALVVVVGVIGGLGYVAVTNPAFLGLTAPEQPIRRPSVATHPTARPPASANNSSTATQQPETPPAQPEAVARFAALAANPNISVRVKADASVRVNAVRLNISMTVDQAGRDFTMGMRMRMNGRSVSVKMIVKDDVAYARIGRGGWTRATDPSELDIPAQAFAFSQLKVDQAVLVRTITRRGKELHLLRVPSTVATGVDEAEFRRLGCDTDDLGLDLWVRDDGTPVSATFDYTCESGGETMVLSATYKFSKVNQPIAINVPPRFR